MFSKTEIEHEGFVLLSWIPLSDVCDLAFGVVLQSRKHQAKFKIGSVEYRKLLKYSSGLKESGIHAASASSPTTSNSGRPHYYLAASKSHLHRRRSVSSFRHQQSRSTLLCHYV